MNDILQTLTSGTALGCLYAVIALGFVVIIRASGVLNLAQGVFVLLGAYVTYSFTTAGVPFFLALILSMIVCAALSILIEAFVVHRISTDLFTSLLVTFGLAIIAPPIITAIWGPFQLNLHDPWGLDVLRLGPVAITQRDLYLIIATGILVLAFFLFFRYSKFGLLLRATAMDSEAALAQGVSTRFVFGLSWALAGALGAFAGTMLATTVGGGVRPGLEHYALLALPVIILGGLDSPLGAVIGGLIIGIVQQFSVTMIGDRLGSGFADVVPYLVLVIIMLVRPTGLFGSKRVRRA
ncbi:branched-chain amino acid ABC transporter permease [Pseudarthrobacter sp. NPDC058329]|uniref:branched-chain amino acid ABC transporter permease n=1 Tax=Pseudarthrobacter sp. NPDC058329 TaxID=3346448 RepID=UPI0036DE7A17